MKRILLTFAALFVSIAPASADLLGFEWETAGKYNIDTEVSTLTQEVGKTIPYGSLSFNVNADFDIINTEFQGTDYKASLDVVPVNGLEIYLQTGLDKEWAREDLELGFTLNF